MPPSGQSPVPEKDGFRGRLDVESLSDIGLRRSNNQDSVAIVLAASEDIWEQRGDLFMVADGMGAHAAGELASKLSVDTVPLVYQKLADHTPAEALLAAMEEANAQIYSRGQASADFKGMGTTTTALVLLPFGALAAHVGDSRVYRLRGTRLEQLTFDHSLVWEMRAAGLPEYGPKNVITRSLGPSPSVKVDIEGPHPIVPGDTFLLCSDGLSGPVKDEEMGMVLGSMPPAEAARSLVDLANMRGGPDNVTVIVAKTVGPLWSQAACSDMPRSRAALRPVHATVWIAFGVLLLAGIFLFWMQQLIPAAVSLAAAIVLGTGAWLYRQGGDVEGPAMNGNRFGKGPYTALVCPPSAEFVHRLADTLHDLREAAARDEWTFDTSSFDALRDRAVAANHSGDFAQAVRCYCQAMSFLVAAGKRQSK